MEYIPTEEEKEYLAYDSYEAFFENLDKGMKEIRNVQFTRKRRKVILIAGAMVVFDKGTIDFLNDVAEAMKESCQFILLSEVTAQYRRKTRDKIEFEYLCTPHLLAKEICVPHLDIPITKEITRYIDKKTYLKMAVDNLKTRHKNMGAGYAEALIYYSDVYLREVLKRINPDEVILWNEFYAFHMVFQSICMEKKLRTGYMEFGCIPGTFVIEQTGQQGESMPARRPFRFRCLSITQEEKETAKNVIQYIYRTGLNRNIQPARGNRLCEMLKRSSDRKVITYMGQNDFESGLYPYTKKPRGIIRLILKVHWRHWNI